MDHNLKQSARLERLRKLAHQVPQVALNRHDDLDGALPDRQADKKALA
jgi:hypothetical protein